MPMEDFDEILGNARFDRLATEARVSDVRITELERLVEELQAEARLAAQARLIMLERIGKIER